MKMRYNIFVMFWHANVERENSYNVFVMFWHANVENTEHDHVSSGEQASIRTWNTTSAFSDTLLSLSVIIHSYIFRKTEKKNNE